MKTIGLIGGISWQSTAEYYRIINQTVAAKLGGNASAKILLYSVNFHEIEEAQIEGNWEELAQEFSKIGKILEGAGADCLLICANTMHKVADRVQQNVAIPLLHIGDVAGTAITQKKMSCVGLLGTRFTMRESFYKDRLREKFEIKTLIPTDSEIEFIYHTIHNELIAGKMVASI